MSSVVLLARPVTGAASVAVAGRMMAFLDYFAGVFTLISLTAVVAAGLAATDRLVLTPRLRVAVQSVHRASAVAALGFLATHIAVKVVERHAAPQTAVVPFTGGAALAVSLGTIAADLLVLITATGVFRGRFAGRRPWLWRVLHSTAYLCWPVALAHGLTAGRAAHPWVLWGYGLCAALVALALLVRVLSYLGSCLGRHRPSIRRRRGARTYQPAAVRPSALTALSARPTADTGPITWPAGAPAARRPATPAGMPGQPKHAARPVPRPLRLAQPGSNE
ncbi:hypothetical protein [Streptomyces malaysiense]|uniref:Ferric oxidoreductase domain-containing protein n=1 Tax=Streptomyces malaysiense TaxID=1428626 RepID=A0A1J4PU96_9ACTN|nr:hypothetical protein [Streptomyces malaysiense]OIK24345.1 hypothetical protein VT52_028135 [Streptomyces malaysiense]